MKPFVSGLCLCLITCLVSGCSDGKLSRREAAHLIDAMQRPHPVGPKKVMRSGVPGFTLASDDKIGTATFHLNEHKEYGGTSNKANEWKSTDSETNLVEALTRMGYVTVQEDGPKTVEFQGVPLHYLHSRTVRLAAKAGTAKETGYSKDYSSGISCYPEPDFLQCNTPELGEMGEGYTITGIVQDETHAKVNLLIPWKLTAFGKELKPYAAVVEANEAKLGEKSGLPPL